MLAACKEVDDTVVLSIAKNCPRLKRLSLRGCRVTDPSVCEIAIHCHNLLLLALAGLHKLTDKCVIALVGNCPYLEELYISGCGMITPAATRYLQVNMHTIQNLASPLCKAPIPSMVFLSKRFWAAFTSFEPPKFFAIQYSWIVLHMSITLFYHLIGL